MKKNIIYSDSDSINFDYTEDAKTLSKLLIERPTNKEFYETVEHFLRERDRKIFLKLKDILKKSLIDLNLNI